MNSLAVAVLLAAVACASAGGIIAPALGLVSARGALEGALGGQWIPDVPVQRSAVIAAPSVYSAPLGLAAPLGVPVAAPLSVPVAAPLSVPVAAPAVVSKGALEGALGGQWIPDVLGK